jgi:uroporphyrinogen-III synthase
MGLERLGYQTALEPLLSIVPLAMPRPDRLFDAVIVTSSSALSSLESRQQEMVSFFGLPCFCVGPRTADKARQFGFRNVQNAQGDGAELARFAGQVLGNQKASILHIAGRDADSNARLQLEKQGYRVQAWTVYETVPVEAFTVATRVLFEKRQLDAVMVFSPRTAETLAKLLANHALEACCESLDAICLSDAIANALKPLSWRQIAVASAPSENAAITRLQEICPVKS